MKEASSENNILYGFINVTQKRQKLLGQKREEWLPGDREGRGVKEAA